MLWRKSSCRGRGHTAGAPAGRPCPLEKRHFAHRPTDTEGPCEHRGRAGGTPGTPEAGGGKKDRPRKPPEGERPCDALTSDSGLKHRGRVPLC